jgi:hypothetical protein
MADLSPLIRCPDDVCQSTRLVSVGESRNVAGIWSRRKRCQDCGSVNVIVAFWAIGRRAELVGDLLTIEEPDDVAA